MACVALAKLLAPPELSASSVRSAAATLKCPLAIYWPGGAGAGGGGGGAGGPGGRGGHSKRVALSAVHEEEHPPNEPQTLQPQTSGLYPWALQ